MRIAAVRCGNSSIDRIMLGGRVIWQNSSPLFFAGGGYSQSFATAHFRLAGLKTMQGTAASFSDAGGGITTLAIDIICGSGESSTHTHSAMQLISVLCMAADALTVYGTDTKGRNPKALLMQTVMEAKTAQQAAAKLLFVVDMAASEKEKITAHSTADTLQAAVAAGRNVYILPSSAVGASLYIADISAKEASVVAARDAVAGINTTQGLGAEGGWTVLGSGTGSLGFAQPAAAYTQLLHGTAAYGRLFDTHGAGGNGKTAFFCTAAAVINAVTAAAGRENIPSYAIGYTNRYLAFRCKGLAAAETTGSAVPAVWFIPTGDGVPLREDDGTDITKNGTVLEIRQAYSVIKDKENGILEVI